MQTEGYKASLDDLDKDHMDFEQRQTSESWEKTLVVQQ